MGRDPAGRQASDTETSGVIGRPPLLFLAVVLLGHVLDHLLPRPFVVPGGDVVPWSVGGLIILIGLALIATGISNFARAETPVPTNRPTRNLVTTGIHAWSRNPIYVGMFLVYVGIGIAARSAWTVLLTLPLAFTIRYGVIAREEAYLERRFGEVYRDYKTRVPRWL